MNLRVAGQALVILVTLALVLYGLSGFINAQIGVKESIFGEAWKLIALALALAILAGFAYPHFRGIKQGDQLVAFVARQTPHGLFSNVVLTTALQDGRKGSRIGVQVMNGAVGEGIILSYGGAFTPPTIKLLETELHREQV